MSNCKDHPKEVAGISDMKVLAEMIGDLHYMTLADLIKNLADKMYYDGQKDLSAKRKKLGNALIDVALELQVIAMNSKELYEISKPFMEVDNKTKKNE